ncbi:MAG: hypothetical protein C4547_00145 [Phycisphaerales bacterium]|nr:MAG: hypothetical protein C4547_00145 [Phycisphaerales bacterium]
MQGKLSWLGSVALAAALSAAAHAGQIDEGLDRILTDAGDNAIVSTLVALSDAVDIDALDQRLERMMADRGLRHRIVVEELMNRAAMTQGPLVQHLIELEREGLIARFDVYWVTNMISVDATAPVIRQIAERDDVGVIYFNNPIELIEPVGEIEENGAIASAPEPGIRIIGADRVWSELGITGEGVVVATLDTGVDGNHPALARRWRGVADDRYRNNPEWAWYDPVTNTRFPQAFGGHGTHTMGTVCGGFPGDEVGVAPGAQWIHCAVIDRVSIPRTVEDAIKSLQWLVDPDGNPNTDFDVAHVCSNSWGVTTGHGYPPCAQTFWAAIDGSEAAGTIQLWSAGNEGNSGLRRPADRATTDYNTVAVAACDGNNPDCPIASFSSRGPTNCTPNGQPAIKPDIAAPGVNVRSSLPGGGYGNLSGTSMASPHVNGVVALMREANKDIDGDDIKQIIYDTATDKGTPGEDNSFGWGLINAYEAVVQVLGDPEPFACCFKDGHCEDLLGSDCRDRGGKSKFNEFCRTFDCPQPGACCITNSECEITLEADCLLRGGDFIGEGVSCELACPCDVIKKMKGTCKGSGTIKATVKFRNNSWDGRVIKMGVGDRLRFDVTVHGKKAVLYTCCFNGPQTVKLLDPDGCLDPIVINCPE